MQRIVFVILSVVIATTSANYNQYLGEREHGDILLEQKKIDRNPDQESQSLKVLQFTDPITLDSNARITRVEIIDYQQKKTSAQPTVIDGGPGYSSVTINFVSQRGYGIHYIVKIYGKRMSPA